MQVYSAIPYFVGSFEEYTEELKFYQKLVKALKGERFKTPISYSGISINNSTSAKQAGMIAAEVIYSKLISPRIFNLEYDAELIPILPSACGLGDEHQSSAAYILSTCMEDAYDMNLLVDPSVFWIDAHASSHRGGHRWSAAELVKNIADELDPDPALQYVLVDDVFTTGAHMKSIRDYLFGVYGDFNLVGLTLAMSVRSPVDGPFVNEV